MEFFFSSISLIHYQNFSITISGYFCICIVSYFSFGPFPVCYCFADYALAVLPFQSMPRADSCVGLLLKHTLQPFSPSTCPWSICGSGSVMIYSRHPSVCPTAAWEHCDTVCRKEPSWGRVSLPARPHLPGWLPTRKERPSKAFVASALELCSCAWSTQV